MNAPSGKSSPVSVVLTLVGFEMRPEAVTERLGLEPTHTDLSHVKRCGSGRKEECGLWSWDSSTALPSPDVEEHLDCLVRTFGPLKSRFEEIRPKPNIFVLIRCPSISPLVRFKSPNLQARHVAAIGELGASVSFELFDA